MRPRPVALSLLMCVSLVMQVQAQTPAAPQSPRSSDAGTRRALLIGINEYRAVPSLRGSLNDIAAVQEVLVTRWGFERAQVRTLTDSAATRAGILEALNRLVREAQPQDFVYLHYSGHGSQVEDLNGDEEDGLDETLVPYDGRTGSVPDITDDELDAALARLRSVHTIVVLDSCHSGTATRALDIRTRLVPRDTRTELYPRGAVQARAVVPMPAARHVVMSAAASNQEALDGPVDGRYHGFFTYSLTRSLGAAPANATAQDVFAAVAVNLNRIKTQFGRASMPEPQLEGPPARLQQPIAPASGSARIAWVEVRRDAADRVQLLRGVALGAVPGSRWAIYPTGETQFTPGHALATATVISTSGENALAVAQSAGSVPSGGRAVPALPPPGAANVAIRLRDVPAERRHEVEGTLARDIRNVKLVGPGEPAQFVIDLVNEDLRLLTADGLQVLATFGAGRWTAGLGREVERIGTAASLLSLDNPAAELRVAARVADVPVLATRGIALVPDVQPAGLRVRRAGVPRSRANSLQLEVAASADAYLTIVDVDSDGRVNLLFPNPFQRPDFLPEGRVRAGTPVRIPDELSEGNRAGFHWDYAPPTGIDTIRVFATADLELARLLRRRLSTMQGDTVTRGLSELREELTQVATRGIATVPTGGGAAPASGDWAAATVTVRVHE